jgi:hypothetical protein
VQQHQLQAARQKTALPPDNQDEQYGDDVLEVIPQMLLRTGCFVACARTGRAQGLWHTATRYRLQRLPEQPNDQTSHV